MISNKRIKSNFVAYISIAFDNHYKELLNGTKIIDKYSDRDLKYTIATDQLTEFYDDNSELPKKDEVNIWAEEACEVAFNIKASEKINKVVDNISQIFNELLDSALRDLREEPWVDFDHIDFNDYKKIFDETKQEFKNLFNRE